MILERKVLTSLHEICVLFKTLLCPPAIVSCSGSINVASFNKHRPRGFNQTLYYLVFTNPDYCLVNKYDSIIINYLFFIPKICVGLITLGISHCTSKDQKTKRSDGRHLLKDSLLNSFFVSPMFWSSQGHLGTL